MLTDHVSINDRKNMRARRARVVKVMYVIGDKSEGDVQGASYVKKCTLDS